MRGLNPIMAEYVPEIYWFLEFVPEYHIPANGILVTSEYFSKCPTIRKKFLPNILPLVL